MSVTMDDARVRFVEEMDVFLGGIRSAYDDSDPEHMIRKIDYLRLQILGLVPNVFEKGVIFGLEICQEGDLQHLYQGGIYPAGSGYLSIDPNSWVLSRGEVWDGTSIVQIMPSGGYDFVYQLSLPPALSSADNSIAVGGLFYITSTKTFSVVLLGQTGPSNPAMFIEKKNTDVDEFVDSVMGYNDLNDGLIVPAPTNGIRIARLVIDVDSFDDGEFTVYARDERDLYPFPTGMSCDEMRLLSKKISDTRKLADMDGFDETIVSGILLPVFRSSTWVPNFETFWSSPRTMPPNVRYYYDILEDLI